MAYDFTISQIVSGEAFLVAFKFANGLNVNVLAPIILTLPTSHENSRVSI